MVENTKITFKCPLCGHDLDISTLEVVGGMLKEKKHPLGLEYLIYLQNLYRKDQAMLISVEEIKAHPKVKFLYFIPKAWVPESLRDKDYIYIVDSVFRKLIRRL